MTHHLPPEVWALVDTKQGHRNQVLGVAEALGYGYAIKELRYTKYASWPNWLKGASLIGINQKESDRIGPPWPDIVIGAGRRVAPVSRYIKRQAKKAGKSCYTVQLMWPGAPTHGIDLIAVPEHDGIPAKVTPNQTIITTIGAPHRVNKARLDRETDIWAKTLGETKHPRVVLLAGAFDVEPKVCEEHMRQLAQLTYHYVKESGGSLWVSNSRRTPEHVTQAIKRVLRCEDTHTPDYEVYVHEVTQSRANPYYAFLALADIIIVSGDSISMCSEACATGKPVYVYAPKGLIPPKHQRFLDGLFRDEYAKRFDERTLESMKSALSGVVSDQPPLDMAQFVADMVKQRRA